MNADKIARPWLCHHGVKGQRWGVKNGPPYPLTDDAKKNNRRNAANANKKQVDDIVKSLSYAEKKRLGLSDEDIADSNYLSTDQGEYVLHRVLTKIGKIPVSFFDMLDDGDTINLALATRSGSEYRGKGYASDAASQAMTWLHRHPNEWKDRDVVWGVRTDNAGSIAIAKKLGFQLDPGSENDGWVNYVYRHKG